VLGAAVVIAVAMMLGAAPVRGSVIPQDAEPMAQPERLTLDDAIRLAIDNNPEYQRTRNDLGPAEWGVREAYGRLLPSANISSSARYTEAGVQRIGTLDFGQQSTDWFTSNYSLGVNWSIDGRTIFGIGSARARRLATDARIQASRFDLESTVTLRYMAALRARDGVDVARREHERARENFEIVRTRVEAGTAAGTEGKQAEIDLGRAEVALIRAEQALVNEKLLLAEQIGVTMAGEFELVGDLTVFDPAWSLEALVESALARNPSLRALDMEASASRARVRQERSSYFPRISVSAGWGGNTREALNDQFLVDQAEANAHASLQNCQRWQLIQNAVGQPLPGLEISDGCGSGTITAAQRASILESNDVFPFDFTQNPFSMGLTVSIPLFEGFSRQRQVEEAQAAERDARHGRRAEELRLRTAVTRAYNALTSAHRVVRIEQTNRELAAERLELARQRYRIGAYAAQGGLGGARTAGSTFLELLDAQSSMTTAERDHLDAVYDFHLALAQLEAATGRRLRDDSATTDE